MSITAAVLSSEGEKEKEKSTSITSEDLMAKVIIFNKIRQQCSSEMKILDESIEAQMSMHEQLEQCFNRKGALEMDYSKRLMELSKNIIKTGEEPNAFTNLLMEELSRLSHYHGILSSLYSNMSNDLQNSRLLLKSIYERCCDMGCELHEHIIKTLAQLRFAAKQYMQLEAQVKLITADNQKHKTGSKYKHHHSAEKEEKEQVKRNRKLSEASLLALKARNEYHLLLDAANMNVHKYFVEDLLELLNCLDLGMDALIYRAAFLHVCNAQQRCNKILMFQNSEDNIKLCVKAQKLLYKDMEQKIEDFSKRLEKLRTESADITKTLQANESNLMLIYKNYESMNDQQKAAADMDYYLLKIKEYLHHINSSIVKPRPKLFGGSLLEYLNYSNERIPNVIRSCCRIIGTYGLKHQGIFRVSGSQAEINNIKEQFEKGLDPLAHQNDSSDINSIAAVLKLYLRELKEPLIAQIVHPQFLACFVSVESQAQLIQHIQHYLKNIPALIHGVIQYLFSFLHRLSLHSADNMMDAHNLAICFGPTLVPMAPPGFDQVLYQNQVNLFIKHLILHYDQIFEVTSDTEDKYYNDYTAESSNEFLSDDLDSQLDATEEEEDFDDLKPALVQYDFRARSQRELNLNAGDLMQLKKQISADWWLGVDNNGKEGLVPSKYVALITLCNASEPLQNVNKNAKLQKGTNEPNLSNTSSVKVTEEKEAVNKEEKLFETRV